jgi:hypothetical protein
MAQPGHLRHPPRGGIAAAVIHYQDLARGGRRVRRQARRQATVWATWL